MPDREKSSQAGLVIKDAYGWNREYQEQLAAVLVQHTNVWSVNYDAIIPEAFSFRDLRAIIQVVHDYYDKYGKTPDKSVLQEEVGRFCRVSLSMKAEEMMEYVNLATRLCRLRVTDSDHLCNSMVDFAREQAIKGAILQAQDILNSGEDYEVHQLRKLFDEAFNVGGSGANMGLSMKDIAVDLPGILRDRELHSFADRIRTGIPMLDESLRGGLGIGELGVVMAGTKVGKSHTLVHFGANAVRGQRKALYVTFELQALDVAQRIMSNVTGMSAGHMLQEITFPEYKRRVEGVLVGGFNFRVAYFPPRQATVDSIRSLITRLSILGDHPDLVLVDYADKIQPTRYLKKDDPYLQMGGIYEDLIATAYAQKCAIWTASQTNRFGFPQSEEQVIGMEAVADSWRKMCDADVIVVLNQTFEEHNAGVMRMFLAGSRRGEDHKLCKCQIYYDRSYIEQIAELSLPHPQAKHRADGISSGKKGNKGGDNKQASQKQDSQKPAASST